MQQSLFRLSSALALLIANASCCFSLLLATPCIAHASDRDLELDGDQEFRSGFGELPQFGGPSSVSAELRAADAVKEPAFRFDDIQRGLAPWFEWKGRAFEQSGLALGAELLFLYQHATDSVGEDQAAGAMYRFPGELFLVGRDTPNSGGQPGLAP